jgi:hypothetical protein
VSIGYNTGMSIVDFIYIQGAAAVLLVLGMPAALTLTRGRSKIVRILALTVVVLAVAIADVVAMVYCHLEYERLMQEFHLRG